MTKHHPENIRPLYDDFELVHVTETFTASQARLMPSTQIAVVPLMTEKGPTSMFISRVHDDPKDPEFYNAKAKVLKPGHENKFIIDRSLHIHKDANLIKVGEELIMDPDHEKRGLKSKKLWAGLGAVTVTLAGIIITRRVLRARKK